MANINATVTKISASTESVTILPTSDKGDRSMATIYNSSTASLYLKYGEDATIDSFTIKLMPNDYLELPHPCYTGRIDGFWDALDGCAMVTEIN